MPDKNELHEKLQHLVCCGFFYYFVGIKME